MIMWTHFVHPEFRVADLPILVLVHRPDHLVNLLLTFRNFRCARCCVQRQYQGCILANNKVLKNCLVQTYSFARFYFKVAVTRLYFVVQLCAKLFFTLYKVIILYRVFFHWASP